MLGLDKKFFPVIHSLYKKDLSGAQTATLRLQKEFQKFNNKYESYYKDREWKANFFAASESLEKAIESLETKNEKSAFYQIDRFRYEWIDLRSRYDIDYAYDYLWEVEAMIEILNVSIQYNPECPIDWFEYLDLSNEMLDSFKSFENLNEYNAYNYSTYKRNRIELAIKNLGNRIRILNSACLQTDWSLVVHCSKNILDDYLILINAIGEAKFEIAFTTN